jgi:hypothetical protein
MKIYNDIPVMRQGLANGEPIGKAKVVVYEEEGLTEILIQTTTSEFNDFLEQGNLKALELNAMVVAPIPSQE